MTSLRKLIVVDSFAASRIREVLLDGHVHVSGRNGRGKTTLIRLIPLFYGEQPSRIVKTSGSVVRSLKDFMFSRSTSYVAFEYENADGIKLAILHYSGDVPQYHLADGPYAKELFVVNEALIEGRHLNAHLRTLGRNPSSALGVLQYRAIIQGTAGRQGMSEIRPLMQRFALVAGKSRLAGIERISSGMFSKDITFSALKQMAASVAFDEEDKQVVLALSRKEIEAFLPDFKAYQAVMEIEPEYWAANQAHLDAGIARSRQIHAAARLKRLVLALGKMHVLRRAQTEAAEQALSMLQRQQQAQAAQFALEAERATQRIKDQHSTIERIDADQKQWAAQKIEPLAALVDQMPALGEVAHQLEKRHRVLVSAADSVNQKFQALFAEEKSRRTTLRLDEQTRSAGTTAAINAERETVRNEREAEWKHLRARHQQESAIAQEAWQETVARVTEWDQQLASLAPDAALAAAVASAGAHLADAGTAQARAVAAAAALDLEAVRMAGDLRMQEQAAAQLAAKAGQADARVTYLLSLENAGSTTLLHYLRKSLPGWHEDIAKVIREDLLLRTDLAPANGEGENLYGLALNLTRIDAGRAASEAALTADLEAARQAHTEAAKAQQTASRALTVARAGIDQNRQKLEHARLECAHADDAVAQARSAQDAARQTRDHELAARRAGLAAARAQAHAQAQACKQSMTALEGTQRAAGERLHRSFDLRLDALQTRLTAEDARKEQALAALKRDEEETRRGLEGVRMSELACAGVDTKALSVLEREWTDARDTLERARKGAPAVESWRRWLTQAPQLRAEAARRVEELTLERERIERTMNEAESLSAAQIASQQASLATCRDTEQAVRERLARAEEAQQNRLAGIETEASDEAADGVDGADGTDGAAATWSLGEILSAFDDARVQWQQHEKQVRSRLGVIFRLFRKPEHGATKVGEFAAHFADDFLSHIPATLALLAEWYATAHTQQRDVLAGKIRNGCGMLLRFQDSMRSFQSAITGLSRELQESLAADMVFEAIRSLHLRLSALVERRPYWDALTRVAIEHEKWQADGYAGLPGKALLDELQDFARHLPDGSLAERPETLMDLEIEVDDGNEVKRVRSEADLRQVSSNGLSYLILCVIFVAFANRARRQHELWLTWALDEISTIDEGNARALLDMLNRNRIRLLSASPDARESLQVQCHYRSEVQPEFEIQRFANEDELAALAAMVERPRLANQGEPAAMEAAP